MRARRVDMRAIRDLPETALRTMIDLAADGDVFDELEPLREIARRAVCAHHGGCLVEEWGSREHDGSGVAVFQIGGDPSRRVVVLVQRGDTVGDVRRRVREETTAVFP